MPKNNKNKPLIEFPRRYFAKNAEQKSDVLLIKAELAGTDKGSLPKGEWEALKAYGGVKKSISRKILLPSDYTFHNLHFVLQLVFGWRHSHLHCFLPNDADFYKLVGNGEGSVLKYMDACGIYFRFPDFDFKDDFWDDDFDEDYDDIMPWLRGKAHNCDILCCFFSDEFIENRRMINKFRDFLKARFGVSDDGLENILAIPTFEEYINASMKGKELAPKVSSLKKCNIDNFLPGFEDDGKAFRKSLKIGEVLCAGNPSDPWKILYPQLSDVKVDKAYAKCAEVLSLRTQKYTRLCEFDKRTFSDCLKMTEYFLGEKKITVPPISNSLVYQYDYGDGWEVKLTVEDAFTFTEYWADDFADGENYKTAKELEKAIADGEYFTPTQPKKLAYNSKGEYADGELYRDLAFVCRYQKALCIEKDGIDVFDDAGGVGGYIEFLKTLNEGSKEEKANAKAFGRMCGFTSKDKDPRNML